MVIPLNEQKNEKKVKFINLPKEFESHYRVYFNNDKDDKKRNYLTKDDKVEFGNTKYKAISEEKVTTAVRKELISLSKNIFIFSTLSSFVK